MPSETVAPGSIASISVDSAEKLVTSVPSTDVMTSPFSSTPCAPLPVTTPPTVSVGGHRVAELLQGRDGGVLLGGGHLGLALLGDLLLGLVRREERLDRHHGVGRRRPAAHHVGQRHRVAGPARGRHRGQPQLAGRRVGLRAADLDQGLAAVLAERVQRRAGRGDRVRQRQRDGDREQQRQRHRRHAQHDRPRGGGSAAPGRRRHRAAGGRTGRRRAERGGPWAPRRGSARGHRSRPSGPRGASARRSRAPSSPERPGASRRAARPPRCALSEPGAGPGAPGRPRAGPDPVTVDGPPRPREDPMTTPDPDPRPPPGLGGHAAPAPRAAGRRGDRGDRRARPARPGRRADRPRRARRAGWACPRTPPPCSPWSTQMQQVLASGTGPINTDLTHDLARQTAVAEGDPTVGEPERRAVVDALGVAELWLDQATDLPASGGPARAWSRSEWVEQTLPRWRSLAEPVAARVAAELARVIGEQHLPDEMAGLGLGDGPDDAPAGQRGVRPAARARRSAPCRARCWAPPTSASRCCPAPAPPCCHATWTSSPTAWTCRWRRSGCSWRCARPPTPGCSPTSAGSRGTCWARSRRTPAAWRSTSTRWRRRCARSTRPTRRASPTRCPTACSRWRPPRRSRRPCCAWRPCSRSSRAGWTT